MIHNLILLTGKDDFRLHEKIKYYRNAFRQKYSNGEIETFTNENAFKDLENSAFTPNLFGEKRCIITENFWTSETFELAKKSQFFEKLPNVSDDVTLFIIEPSLDKRLKSSKFLLNNAKIETFEPLDETHLLEWIRSYTQKNEGKIAHREAKILLYQCGENLWRLSREIEKLTLAGDGIITEQFIKELTIPHPKAIIWEFTETLSRKNIPGAIRKLHDLLHAGEPIHQIFAMIIREVRIHTQLRNALDRNIPNNQIASLTKLHPFVVQKTIPLTRNFSQKQIESMYERLFQIDQRMKTGGISISSSDNSELVLAVEKFIVESCQG